MRIILEQAQANLQASLCKDIEAEIQRYGLGGGVQRNMDQQPRTMILATVNIMYTHSMQSKVQEHSLWTEEISYQQLTECFNEVATIENGLLSANNCRGSPYSVAYCLPCH
jgi:hypothetical protein